MKIIAVESLRPAVQPNLLFVRLHSADGITGLGEAFVGATTVETYLHDTAASVLLDAPDVSPAWASSALAPYVGFQGGGVETRGNSAVDMALWDLCAQEAGVPLYRLLGGPIRPWISVYNTCAGPGYVSTTTLQRQDNWGLPRQAGRWEDLHGFLHAPARLARELRDEGFRGMKVWPFDRAAERSGGNEISADDIAEGIAVLEAVRSEVGMDLDLMVELHGLWNRRGATAIAQALTPLRPFWVEDPMRPDAVSGLAALAREVDVPIAVGETVVGRRGFMPLLAADAVDVVTVDVQWSGGLTEAVKICSLADAYGVPVAPHDCNGPATLATCVHLAVTAPNVLIQEVVRAFLRTWYRELVVGLPEVSNGRVSPTEEPGHGVRLRPGLVEKGAVTSRTSAA